jgi:hypothetical protein
MDLETQKHADQIEVEVRKAMEGYIGRPNTAQTMEELKMAVEDAVLLHTPYADRLTDFIDVIPIHDGFVISVIPKKDAPQWVFELFAMINTSK